jgi:hypothetical protein
MIEIHREKEADRQRDDDLHTHAGAMKSRGEEPANGAALIRVRKILLPPALHS